MIREVKFESQEKLNSRARTAVSNRSLRPLTRTVSKISKRQTPFAISMVWILIRLVRTPSLYASRMQNGLMW